jgi:hypothetical protein
MSFSNPIINEDEDLEGNMGTDDEDLVASSLGRNNLERTEFTFKPVETIFTAVFLVFSMVS